MKKNIFGVLILLVLALISCDKNEILPDESQSNFEVIQQLSQKLATDHDMWVTKMLDEEKRLVQLITETHPSKTLELSDYLDVMEKVTGVRPVIGKKEFQASNLFRVSAENGLPVINFDTTVLNLSDFAQSEKAKAYLQKLDHIVQDSILTIDQKIIEIDQIEVAIRDDVQLEAADISSVLNGCYLAKNSMSLWNENSSENNMMLINGLYKANPLKKWSFWSKLGFVAAADAIGGVLGFWLGGYVVVNGVPVYVPPGPTGVAASAAGLSYIASKMVGW